MNDIGGGTKKMLKIDGNKIKEKIKGTGLSITDTAKIFDIPIGTLSAWLSKNEMPDAQLEKVCLFLRAEQKEFILPDEPKAKAAQAAPSDLKAEVEQLNDAMASLVKMMETTMNTVKRISDEVSTLSATEYAASQEQKRYFQTGNAFFKQLLNFLKNGRGTE